MKVEILYFDGCPNHEALVPHLERLLTSAGTDAEIELRPVEDAEAAERERFLGSPTLRIDGEDVDPGAAGRTDFGLKCRLFATPDGLRGMPADEWVLTAIERADGNVGLVRRAWEAFSRGDLDAVTSALDPEVRWHGAGDEDASEGCRNRDEALTFIRGALAEGVTAEAYDFRAAGDRVVVLVRVRQPAAWDEPPEPHGEVVSVRDGKVVEMIVHPTIGEALVAAGLAA